MSIVLGGTGDVGGGFANLGEIYARGTQHAPQPRPLNLTAGGSYSGGGGQDPNALIYQEQSVQAQQQQRAELQNWLTQQDMTTHEQMRLQQQKNSVAHVRAAGPVESGGSGQLTQQQVDDYTLQAMTGINVGEQRLRGAQERHQQALTQQVSQQNALQTSMMGMDATHLAQQAQQFMVPIRRNPQGSQDDEENPIIGHYEIDPGTRRGRFVPLHGAAGSGSGGTGGGAGRDANAESTLMRHVTDSVDTALRHESDAARQNQKDDPWADSGKRAAEVERRARERIGLHARLGDVHAQALDNLMNRVRQDTLEPSRRTPETQAHDQEMERLRTEINNRGLGHTSIGQAVDAAQALWHRTNGRFDRREKRQYEALRQLIGVGITNPNIIPAQSSAEVHPAPPPAGAPARQEQAGSDFFEPGFYRGLRTIGGGVQRAAEGAQNWFQENVGRAPEFLR